MNSGQGAVVTANSDFGNRLAQEIVYSIAAEYGWPDYKPEERTAIQLDPKIIDSYAGEYKFNPGPSISFTAAGDHLAGSIDGEPAEDAYPESETTFFTLISGFPKFAFVKDEKGNVVEMNVGPNQRAKRVK